MELIVFFSMTIVILCLYQLMYVRMYFLMVRNVYDNVMNSNNITN